MTLSARPSPACIRSSIKPLSKVLTGNCICLANDRINARCSSGVLFACFAYTSSTRCQCSGGRLSSSTRLACQSA
ncbi:hypothetical protein D3C76_1050790 [compost metagenome]